MSEAALLRAVRKRLRSDVPLKDHECDVQPDGQPPPMVGDRYVSIHPVNWASAGEIVRGLHERFDVTCTITVRCPPVPRDRLMGNLFLDVLEGMEKLARKVMVTVHNNWDLLADANDLIESPGTNLLRPLEWTRTDPTPEPKGPEWLWANPTEPKAALVMAVHFINAERAQTFDKME